tara:strand:+ start:2338 stop:3099 length:762 start_codon:yes stop_codon:yes gene_type:complete
MFYICTINNQNNVIMKNIKYIYRLGDTVNVLNAKVSQNSKIGIGYIIQTYHFSMEQVQNASLVNDKASCLDCPLSYNQNNGKSGGCYTHKGMQLMGLKSMLRSLNRNLDSIDTFKESDFNTFVAKVKNTYPVDLVRFGAYGEPILLPLKVVEVLSTLSQKTTGYTHQWNKPQYQKYNQFFMSSTHTEMERELAKDLGYRSFFVATNEISGFKLDKAVNCPASKESEKNLSCIACGLCNGNSKGIKKDVFIMKH